MVVLYTEIKGLLIYDDPNLTCVCVNVCIQDYISRSINFGLHEIAHGIKTERKHMKVIPVTMELCDTGI